MDADTARVMGRGGLKVIRKLKLAAARRGHVKKDATSKKEAYKANAAFKAAGLTYSGKTSQDTGHSAV